VTGAAAACRAEYDRYLAALSCAQDALTGGELERVDEAVADADQALAAMAVLMPAIAALRRSAEAGTERVWRDCMAELAELATLAARAGDAVQTTVSGLRDRQAMAMAELVALPGLAGPYAEGVSGGCLVDRTV
jgi:hypothetical protein